MKVSLNLVKDYLDIKLDPAELVELIGRRLGEVEEVIDLKERYKGCLIAKVISAKAHPQADKLKLCQLDDGGVSGAERDDQGYLLVVCGSQAVEAGQYVVYLPPGVVVPATADSPKPQTIAARQIRGLVSQGMIGSMAELCLPEISNDILDLNQDSDPNPPSLKPGADFAKTYQLDDCIIDIENKMFTHRPDCFGLIGVAREIAGITHQAFNSPDWYKLARQKTIEKDDKLKLEIGDKTPVTRLSAQIIRSITVKASPIRLQFRLASLGFKPVNNVVDITNYVMYLTGQPLHAFDMAKLQSKSSHKPLTLMARSSHKSESLKLLSGKTIKFERQATVIATDSQPVALGGIMGGSETEVDDQTSEIVIEAATFDMYDLRRSTMHYGIFSEAATRFTKGQSPDQNLIAQARAAKMIAELAGGQSQSPYYDLSPPQTDSAKLKLEPDFINARLGSDLSLEKMASLLGNVEFKLSQKDGALEVEAPFWRQDIAIAEDIVEEVGRLSGYENLELKLPTRPITPPLIDHLLELKREIRQILAASGANEALAYSFVGADLIAKANQPLDLAYKISNPLSPKLEYYRLSLSPSLLEFVYPNLRQNYDQFALFEIGVAHSLNRPLDQDGLPVERQLTSLVCAQKTNQGQAAFYLARAYLDALAESLAIDISYQPVTPDDDPLSQLYEPSRSARVVCEDQLLGVVGEFKPSTRRDFKLPVRSAGFEIETDLLLMAPRRQLYQPLLVYSASQRDLTFKVAKDLAAAQLQAVLQSCLEQTGHWFELSLGSIYAVDDQTKNISFKIKLASRTTTLTSQEVNGLISELVAQAAQAVQASQV